MKLLFPLGFSMLVSLVSSTPQSRRPPPPNEVSISQESGKRRPPPPPGAGQGNDFRKTNEAGYTFVKKSNTRWIWDENCKDDRPPFEIGRWIQVRHQECPIAFEDPEFDSHQEFCE